MKTVAGNITLFANHVADSTVAFCEGENISFATFMGDVDVLTQKLLPLTGDVLISCKSRYAFSVALLASWQAGKVAILPPNKHTETLGEIGRAHKFAFVCNDVWAESCRQNNVSFSFTSIRLVFPCDQLAVRLYTSGSTGQPKAVEKTMSNLLPEAEMLKNAFAWPNTAIVASVPANHLYGLTFTVLLPWVLAVPLVDEMPLYASEVENCLEKNSSGILITVPIHLKSLMDAGISLKKVMCVTSAAPLLKDTAQTYRQQYGTDPVEIYGSSETGVIAHRLQLQDESWEAFSEVMVTSDAEGLLQVSSPFVNGQPSELFQMSDQVNLLDASRFTLEGRVDSIIKIGGKRISTLMIEQCLMRCHGVEDAAVIAVPAKSHIRDWVVWAAVAVDENVHTNSRDIKRELQKWLDGIAIPRRIITLAKLSREENGKLPKKRLMALFE